MFEKIITIIKNNQFLLTGLGLSGVGLISFWIKDIPLKLIKFLKQQLTVDLIITNYDIAFYELLNYLHTYNQLKQFRILRLHNGRWGIVSESDLTNRTHFIYYENTWLFLNYRREKEFISDKIKETIVLTKFGRSRKLFDKMINDLLEIKKQQRNFKTIY